MAEAEVLRKNPRKRQHDQRKRQHDQRKRQHEKNKCFKKLRRLVGQAVTQFNMLEDGDKVMVCLSGGKDSYTLLDILRNLQQHAPINFELVAVNLDQKQPGFPEHVLPDYLSELDVPFKVLEEDTYSVVQRLTPAGKTTCPVCSRLRRGILYNAAEELGCTKIALGHHREDALETLMLNLMFTGSLKSMPARLTSDDGRNVVIRPLLYCAEGSIARFAELREYPILPCDLCGSQDGLMRQQVKALLTQVEGMAPRAKQSMLAALANIKATHLLDRSLVNAPTDAPAASPDGVRRLPLV